MTCREFERLLVEQRSGDRPDNALSGHAQECADCRRTLQDHAQLSGALFRMAQAMSELDTPTQVELRLKEAFLEQHCNRATTGNRGAWHWPQWGAIAAMLFLVVFAGIQVGRHLGPTVEQTATPATPPQQEVDASTPVAVGSDFIRIGGCFDRDCLRNSQLMRVRIPRSSLLQFGLPMNIELAESEVLADVLVAEDGSAQAIRFVNY